MATPKKRKAKAKAAPRKRAATPVPDPVPATGGGTLVLGQGRRAAQLDPNDMLTRRNQPDALYAQVSGGVEALPQIQLAGTQTLNDLFHGDKYLNVRQELIERGEYKVYVGQGSQARHKSTIRVQLQPIENASGEVIDYNVLAMGAVARDPGKTQDYIDAIQDYLPVTIQQGHQQEVNQLWSIYYNEGIINNAVNKLAAILSSGGHFKVRKAKKGKKQKALEQLQTILDWWVKNVNDVADDAVVTGARGVRSVVMQGVRQCLVEGDWFGRQNWQNVQVGSEGQFALPVNIQAISTFEILPSKSMVGGVELYYWRPSGALIQQLTAPVDPIAKPYLKKFVDSKTVNELKKTNQLFLDPALLCHAKHRGVDWFPFGESFIAPAKQGLAFKRAILALEFVSMQSLINRLTIVMVGSSDKTSAYSKTEVAQARTTLMQQFFEETGPNMVIVWSGNDVDVKDVGAHTAVLDLDGRHAIADANIEMALGMPRAILIGTTGGDGKSAGWASVLGAAAEMEDLQSKFSGILTKIGERIAVQNGFDDVDLIFEFDRSLLVDRSEERNQNRLDYTSGYLSIRTAIAASGRDPDAEYRQRCLEKGLVPADVFGDPPTWEEVFSAPPLPATQGSPGTPTYDPTLDPNNPANPNHPTNPNNPNPPGGAPGDPTKQGPPPTGPVAPPGGGRPKDSTTGKPPAPPSEKKTTKTHK